MTAEFNHLLVVIPGIGGSVLRRGDEDLWKLSPSVAFRALLTRGRSLEELVPDDPTLLDDPDFSDDIEATGLIESPISLPGLARLAGYDGLRQSLHDTYELNDLNYLEFAYDWRRDVRFAAVRLATAIEEKLAELDAYVGRAEVIIVAHSMGGLVARSWLIEHGGGERCRGVITLGTPYRGSPKAMRMLAGGYLWRSVGSARFANLLRQFPAVHQLLPMYPCVHDLRSGELRRVHEVADDLPGIDAERAQHNRDQLTVLNTSEQPALTSVICGIGQSTLQSVTIDENGLLTYPKTPLPGTFGRSSETDGDGTVPWIAARPLDYADLRGLTPSFEIQSHGGLSCDGGVLEALQSRLAHLLVDDDPARAPFEVQTPDDLDQQPRIGFDLDEDYVADESVEIRIVADGFADGTQVTITLDDEQAGAIIVGEQPQLLVGPLSVGVHPVIASVDATAAGRGLRVVDSIDVWPTDDSSG